MDGANLVFTVKVLEGDLNGADGPASVFIDIIGMPGTPMSVAGVARRSAWRGAYYHQAYHPYYGAAAGAALGAAAIGAIASGGYGYHEGYQDGGYQDAGASPCY
jgi:hypothetical protein